jgi:hypothetical protein
MDLRRIRRLLRESSEAEAQVDSEADIDIDSEAGLSGLTGLVVRVRMMHPPPRRGAYDA